ncbi:MAG: hypothetical protein N4A53_11135 [Pelagimonas sp.]|jgi:hypothetical protein|nr:hypothetical protein [Pelagimonas sp.]
MTFGIGNLTQGSTALRERPVKSQQHPVQDTNAHHPSFGTDRAA